MVRKAVPYYTQQFREARRKWAMANPVRKECFKSAEIIVSGMKKWCCKKCKSQFAKSEVQCDHINPIGSNTPHDIYQYIQCFLKLHAPLESLQILCHSCHKIKSKQDNIQSKQQKKSTEC